MIMSMALAIKMIVLLLSSDRDQRWERLKVTRSEYLFDLICSIYLNKNKHQQTTTNSDTFAKTKTKKQRTKERTSKKIIKQRV